MIVYKARYIDSLISCFMIYKLVEKTNPCFATLYIAKAKGKLQKRKNIILLPGNVCFFAITLTGQKGIQPVKNFWDVDYRMCK
jgi:hypothetical protein